jgi:ADP-ribosyl-[dinitrogen reductase] hydrolase
MQEYKRAYDVLLAGAIGDALGYLVEFDNERSIRSKYGNNGVTLSDLPSNMIIVSDDTQMTMFCLNAIVSYVKDNHLNDLDKINHDIYTNYIDWLYTQTNENNKTTTHLGSYAELYKRQAPGHTCLTALMTSIETQCYGSLTSKINDSKGCGGIMRTAPIAFLDLDLKDTFRLGCMQAAITHTHPDGYLSSGFFSAMIKLLSNNYDIEDAYTQSMHILKSYKNSIGLIKYLEKVIVVSKQKNILQGDELNSVIGLGWTGDEALGIALYSVLKEDNLEGVLNLSTNHSGDSDSTASLAAQLYTAKNGLDNKYYDFLEKLDVKEPFKILMALLEKQYSNKSTG